MVNEFDKEIDAILRKARGAETAVSFDSHLDADDISAFAENALPDAARQRYTGHLADCMRCRKILSNVIALNSEAETETASSVVPAEIAARKTPWYRKFFAFPQIAYAMGALVLLFSGFFGYLVLKNLSGGNSEVSFSTNKADSAEKSVPQSAPANSASSNTATAATNSSAPANVSGTTSATPLPNSNSPIVEKIAPTERKTDVPEATPTMNDQPAPVSIPDKIKPADTKGGESDKELAKVQTEEATKPNVSANGAIQEKNQTRDKKLASKDDQRTEVELSAPVLKSTRSAPEPKKQKSEAGATRSVGGKTFNNVGGIWFDSAYTKQKQKTVKRGTNDYQKLDSGLRSIADQFDGTVVVLWKSKAYRIQ